MEAAIEQNILIDCPSLRIAYDSTFLDDDYHCSTSEKIEVFPEETRGLIDIDFPMLKLAMLPFEHDKQRNVDCG